jgi:hypothetical protein
MRARVTILDEVKLVVTPYLMGLLLIVSVLEITLLKMVV